MNEFKSKPLEEKINILREEPLEKLKPWNKGLRTKAIILAPSLIYLIGFVFINKIEDETFLIIAIALGLFLILFLWKSKK